MRNFTLIPILALLGATGCSKDSTDETTDSGSTDSGVVTDSGSSDTGDTPSDTPDTYEFESQLVEGESSVSYSGQSFRQLLMSDMKAYLSKLSADLNAGTYSPAAGDVKKALEFYYNYDASSGADVEIMWSGDLDASQTTYGDVKETGANLTGKIAGNDAKGQHADWAADFQGWDGNGVTTPESLVNFWFDLIDAAAVDWANGTIPTGIDGKPVPHVYITAAGHDLQQLLQKFLGVSIAFSQASDDYMDNDLEDHGLNSDNTAVKEGKNYTPLEHVWDEGFGYFGGSVAYGTQTDDEIKAGSKGADADGDGAINVNTEVNWGHSVNCAKRDLGAAADAATDFTGEAWEGFAAGRQLIADTAGAALTADEMATLVEYRDQAIGAWEKAIAATAVHYVNDSLQDLDAAELDGATYAKHWGELKGFALGFQFNPASPMSKADFGALHDLIGTAPGTDAAYKADLIAARTLIMDAYGFDSKNEGDENGEGGW